MTADRPVGAETSGRLLGVAWRVLAALAGAGAILLAVGLLLPGTWSAERSVTIDAPPDEVFRHVGDLAHWDAWTVWGSVESELSDRTAGEGATRSWDDPFMGEGRVTVTRHRRPDTVRYRVEVEGGSIVTEGSMALESVGEGRTRLLWREEGSFGWNPLMGFAALRMDRLQGTEMRRALARLAARIEGREVPDSLALPEGEARSGPAG